jgi:membrane-bound metal-dependent hydrolase YbcI (DUF457 family)
MAVKAVMQKKFSLLVFAWAQVVMDLQPLVVILTGRGRTHGFTHTLVGAAVLGALAGVSGKYLSEWVLSWRRNRPRVTLRWGVVWFSAWLGTFSHVLIDGLIYPDMDLFWPFATGNPLRIGFLPGEMIRFCVISGVLGALAWGAVALVRKQREREEN